MISATSSRVIISLSFSDKDRRTASGFYDVADRLVTVFRLAGINRVVTVLDPTTRREVRMPISECASSHMARRTFCGNLYKRVKDPNIVASMSGHKEGSKAFARYREIDKDIKRDALKVFEAI